MHLVGKLIMIFKGAMNLGLLVLLLSLISTIRGKETHPRNDLEMKITQATYDVNDFDCVDIHKQPAFSHPSLKNHKIQMNPSFSKNLGRNKIDSFNKVDIGLKGEGCALGKVPIQRKKSNTSFHQFSSTYPGQHFATLQYSGKNDIYHGARARNNVYNPQVVDSQISASYIWVQNGDLSDRNVIQARWAVHPRLYGDNITRLTTYWTKDNYQRTGCYNVQCPGFVQIHPSFHLGIRLKPISIYGGDVYEMDVLIRQDPASLNWWLVFNYVRVGYWPKEIFSHLQQGATHLQYGGWVFVSPDGISPPMGNGHFSNPYNTKCCYYRQVKFVDSTYQEADLDDSKTHTYVDSKCYHIFYWGYGGPFFRFGFRFGGPGGQCGT